MNHPTELTKQVDSKGRVNLGEDFANRTVVIKYRGPGEVVVKRACVIPEREAWLYQNPKTLASMRRGLDDARGRRFAKNKPNFAADAKRGKSSADDA